MNNRIAALVAFVGMMCSPTSVVHAELIVSVREHKVNVGAPQVEIAVQVSGGDQVTDMSGFLQIADGGMLLGGSEDGPKVTAVGYSGSIWEQAPGGFTSFYGDSRTTPTSQVVDPQVSLNVLGETVIGSGTLLSLTVDLEGFTRQEDFGKRYPLTLSNLDLDSAT